MLVISWLLSTYITLVVSKSTSDSKFEKYTYKSEYTNREIFQSTFSKTHLEILKNETAHLFNYAWDKYMEFGYPYDEVCPLSCQPNKRDLKNQYNTVKNDALGNFSVTLFDAMDNFIIMGDKERFEKYVQLIKDNYKDFAIDSTIQVFETNIRLLGSLLTSHLYAIDPRRGFKIEGYDGFLLNLAYDLGKRLVVTFSHIKEDMNFGADDLEKYFTFNYPRTNLLKGPHNLSTKLKSEQCTAGITSLTLEFSLLSRLTNDTIFEDISRRAVLDFWGRRSSLDLVSMSFDTTTRSSPGTITGIGASIDSFYEYALKYAILFDDDIFYDIWKTSYKALLTHSQNRIGIFTNLDVNTGMQVTEWIDSLAAFFPGLQVLGGDLKNAIKLHKIYFKLWNNYRAVPERWNYLPLRSEGYFQYLERPYQDGDLIYGLDEELTNEVLVKNSVGLEWYPLRPELIESTYHLYRATKDVFYLRLGEDFLEALRMYYLAPCGFSGLLHIVNDQRQDRQESFVLSETLKYLYLLFDVDNKVQSGNTVFTTEGHAFWYDRKLHTFDPSQKEGLRAMNEVIEEGGESANMLSRFLKGESFNLNKEFSMLKTYFYEGVKKVNPMVYRIRNLYAFERNEAGEIMGNSYGNTLRIGEEEYVGLSQIEKRNMANILSKSLIQDDNLSYSDDYLRLDICEKHDSHAGEGMLKSAIFNEDRDFYRLDWEYAMTLRRPLYLYEREGLELGDTFYRTYGSGNGERGSYAVCNVEQTTNEWEALMSSNNTFSIAPIYRFTANRSQHKKGPQADDLYLAELEGLRIQLEELVPGKINRDGEYIKNYNMGEVTFRVTKVNGLEVGKGTTIWVYRNSVLLHNSDTVTTDNKYVMIGDKRVLNLRIHVPEMTK